MALGRKTGGRTKGTPNKAKDARENFSQCFLELGGVEALKKWAKENQTDFYKLYGRLIPVESHVSGPNGDPIPIAVDDARDALLGRLGSVFAARNSSESDGATLQ